MFLRINYDLQPVRMSHAFLLPHTSLYRDIQLFHGDKNVRKICTFDPVNRYCRPSLACPLQLLVSEMFELNLGGI